MGEVHFLHIKAPFNIILVLQWISWSGVASDGSLVRAF